MGGVCVFGLRLGGTRVERNMKVPIPEPPTKLLEGDREFTIVGKIKPELPHITLWGNQENIHVQYSNTLINILRTIKTHILTCYRPTME